MLSRCFVDRIYNVKFEFFAITLHKTVPIKDQIGPGHYFLRIIVVVLQLRFLYEHFMDCGKSLFNLLLLYGSERLMKYHAELRSILLWKILKSFLVKFNGKRLGDELVPREQRRIGSVKVNKGSSVL